MSIPKKFTRYLVMLFSIVLLMLFTAVISVNIFLSKEKEVVGYFIYETLGVLVDYQSASVKFLPKFGISFKNLVLTNPKNASEPYLKSNIAYVDVDLIALLVDQVLIDEIKINEGVAQFELFDGDTDSKNDSNLIYFNSLVSRVKKISLENLKLIYHGKDKSYDVNLVSLSTSLNSDFGSLVLPEASISFVYEDQIYSVLSDNLVLAFNPLEVRLQELVFRSIGGNLKLSDLKLGVDGLQKYFLVADDFDLSLLPGFLSIFTKVSSEIKSQRGLLNSNLEYQKSSEESLLQGSLSLKQYKIKSKQDLYKADLLSGQFKLLFKESGEKIVNSDLVLRGFGYSDEQTKVDNVDAKLNNIVAKVDSQTNVNVKLDVDGSNLTLEAPSVKIMSISSMSGPLNISVPDSGGYLVSGPVTLKGGKMSVFDRNLEQASGTAEISVAKKLKTFKTSHASHLYRDNMQSYDMKLEITPKDYIIKDVTLSQGNGFILFDGQMFRGGEGEFSFDAKAKAFDFPSILSFFVDQDTVDDYSGVLDHLSVHAQGKKDRFLETVSASGDFVFKQGILKAVDLNAKVIDVLEQVKFIRSKEKAKVDDDERKQEMRSSFKVVNGKVLFDDLKIKRSWYSIDGKGKLDFNLKLDLDARIVLLRETFKLFGLGIKPLQKVFQEIGSIEVPIEIEGELPEIEVKPDLKEMAKLYSGISLLESVWKGIVDVVD